MEMSEELERMAAAFARAWCGPSKEAGNTRKQLTEHLVAEYFRVRNAALDEAAGVNNSHAKSCLGNVARALKQAAAAILALKEPT